MKTAPRIRIAGIATIITALLVIMSATGLAFAEEAPQATLQETSQVPVQITPQDSKPFGRRQLTPMIAKIASIINMKVEDVIAARHEGKSFVEIAAEKGISESELVDALLEERKAFLDTQVAGGRLAPEKAGTAIAKMEEDLKLALNRKEIGPPETRPSIGQNISGKNMSRIHTGHGRSAGDKQGFMKGFSQGFQARQKVGLRQGLRFGKGQDRGVCPFCGQTQNSDN